MKYNVLILIAYVFGGVLRGTTINVLTTEIIRMYSANAKVPFNSGTGYIISILSTSVIIGSMCASLFFTYFNNKFGRRNTLIIASVISLVSNALSCVAYHWVYLAVMRILAGLGTTLVMVTMPMLFSEFVAPNVRGVYSSLINYFMGVGAIFSCVLQIFQMGDDKLYYVAFLPATVCATGCTVVCFFIKENVAQKEKLVVVENDESAQKIVENKEQVNDAVIPVQNIKMKKESIFQRKYRRCFVFTIGLGLQNSGAGTNPIIAYATIIFKSSFNSDKSPAIGQLLIQTVDVLAATLAFLFIRKLKRKTILLIGLIGVSVGHLSYVLIQTLVNESSRLVPIIIALCVFICAFQVSFGPLYYPILSEVFPTAVKTSFINLTMIIFWTILIIVTFTYPLIVNWANNVIFLCITVIAGVIQQKFLPETKGKSLQEIEDEVVDKEKVKAKQLHIDVQQEGEIGPAMLE